MNRLCAPLVLALLVCFAGCATEKMRSPESASDKLTPLATPVARAALATPPARAAAAQGQAGQGYYAGGGGGGGRSESAASGSIVPVSNEELTKADSSYTDRKIIRNAELSLQTQDPISGQQKIESIAESLGGFVVDTDVKHSNSINQAPPDTTVTVSIRVPSMKFAQALDAIRAVGNKVLDEKETGQDITEEYIDLEARIRTQKALEAQFLEIMKRAIKVSDALEVQSQISEVRTEIERLEGRRRYLENKSALSTIKVVLQTAPPIITATQTGFSDSLKQAAGDAVDIAAAIVNGAIRLVGVMIPVTLMIVLPGALLFRFFWRRLAINKTPPPVAQPE
jgi:hypothetical protein